MSFDVCKIAIKHSKILFITLSDSLWCNVTIVHFLIVLDKTRMKNVRNK